MEGAERKVPDLTQPGVGAPGLGLVVGCLAGPDQVRYMRGADGLEIDLPGLCH
jgi:hypothetical protein